MQLKKVVVAIDSFKGCMSSVELGHAALEGVRDVFPACEVVCVPVADGGEGLLEALMADEGYFVDIQATDPLKNRIDTRYGLLSEGKTALIEMAAISGLTLVPHDKRNPMITTTFGTGELIRDALDRGCRDFIIGIGGSATNDAGMGMLQALGYKFVDSLGHELDGCGEAMEQVADIISADRHPALNESRFTVACDVTNPFCGKNGAAYIFARQKGADDEMIETLDRGMKSFAKVVRRVTGKDIENFSGAGAAGGIGGAFLAFLNAELKPGIKLLLDYNRFDERIEGANLVITGEGRADRQTIMGKVPFGILQAAKPRNIPVFLIAGGIEDAEILNNEGFAGVFPIASGPCSLEEAMNPQTAYGNVKRTITQICRAITIII